MIYSNGSNAIEVAQIGPLRNGIIIPNNVILNFDVEHFEARHGPSDKHYIGTNGYLEVVGSKLDNVVFNSFLFPISSSNFESEVATKFLNPDFLIQYAFANGNQSTYMGIIRRNDLRDPGIDFSRFNIHLFRPVLDI